MSDDEFIEALVNEAKEKADEIDKGLEQDNFQQDMLETAKIVENENKPNLENTNENINENTKDNENKGESMENDGFADSFLSEANENVKLATNFNAKSAKSNENVNESTKSSSSNDSKEKEKRLSVNLGTNQENEQEMPLFKDYFNRKKEEIDINKQSKNKAQSKEHFKEELLNYAQNKMTADEMRVMTSLLHSNNKKITPEHKLLIKNCLEVAQKNNQNFEFLSVGHKAIIRTSSNQTLGTQSIREFINLANNPKDKLDASIVQNCKKECVENILKNNKGLLKETTMKLTALVNPALAKTMEADMEMGKAMAK